MQPIFIFHILNFLETNWRNWIADFYSELKTFFVKIFDDKNIEIGYGTQ